MGTEQIKFSDKLLLVLLMGIYSAGELEHFLLGVVSKRMAQDIHYGDKSCLPVSHPKNISTEYEDCRAYANKTKCDMEKNCEWDYNGLGSDYQILAGPVFMAGFTIAGIFWGIAADKLNRVHLVVITTVIFSIASIGTAFAVTYWHLVLLRLLLAIFASAACPLAAGIIGDIFPQDKRAFAMAIFNFGIYIGYGSSFAVGTYITDTTFFEQTWRLSYFVSGIPGILIAVLFALTVTDPRNALKASPSSTSTFDLQAVDSNGNNNAKQQQYSNESEPKVEIKEENAFVSLIKRPEVWVLCLASCIRHSAGYCWGYNAALYFQTYFPKNEEAAWVLTGISIGAGILGCVVGGYISDCFVNRYGTSNRALVLALSQLVATPFAFGTVYLIPPYAYVTHFFDILASEMWFGVVYALIVEIAPERCRSTAVGVALFVINNAGGNLPILVDPVTPLTDYRTAIMIFYPAALLISSVLFFICWLLLRKK